MRSGRVAVVGGGFTGSVCSTLLHRAGLQVKRAGLLSCSGC